MPSSGSDEESEYEADEASPVADSGQGDGGAAQPHEAACSTAATLPVEPQQRVVGT